MKRSRKIQYTAALTLITVGCGYALQHKSGGFLALCVNASNIVMMKRANLNASVPGREMVWLAAILILIVVLILLAHLYIPKKFDSLAYQPAYLIPFWALLVLFYLFAWRKEAKTPVVTPTGSQ